jgi:hypothetical protein
VAREKVLRAVGDGRREVVQYLFHTKLAQDVTL